MIYYFKRKNLFLLSVFFLLLIFREPVFSLTAYQIMQKVDERYTGETVEQTSTLVLIDKKNRKRERILKGFSKENKSVTKSITFFLKPTDVKDTAYLSYNWEDPKREDES